MRGLLEKDLRLVFSKKQNLFFFCVIILFMGYAADRSFLIGYGAMLFGIWSVSTLSYDEFDNGMPFLMTLPITVRDYVKEKFLFCGLAVVGGGFFSVVTGCLMAAVKGEPIWENNLLEIFGTVFIFVALLSIMIAVELKFGVEKSRTVLLILGGAVFAVGMTVSNVLPENALTREISVAENQDALIFGILIGISVLVTLAAYFISCTIMKKKEF